MFTFTTAIKFGLWLIPASCLLKKPISLIITTFFTNNIFCFWILFIIIIFIENFYCFILLFNLLRDNSRLNSFGFEKLITFSTIQSRLSTSLLCYQQIPTFLTKIQNNPPAQKIIFCKISLGHPRYGMRRTAFPLINVLSQHPFGDSSKTLQSGSITGL